MAVVYTDAMFQESRMKVWKTLIMLGVAAVIIIFIYICMKKPSTRILSGLAEHVSEIRLEEEKQERAEKEAEEAAQEKEKKEEKEEKKAEKEKESDNENNG